MWECEPRTGSHSFLFTFVNTFLSHICAEVQKGIVSTYFMGLNKGGNAKYTCYKSFYKGKSQTFRSLNFCHINVQSS